VPAVDAGDPAAGFLATLSTVDAEHRLGALAAAVHGEDASTSQAVAESIETRLALARALITAGQPGEAGQVLAQAAADPDADWRVSWYQALLQLAIGQAAQARAAFDAVLDALPGEPAPKLALGLAAEAAGDPATAAKYLGAVWTVDRSYVSAAFGLARIMVAGGDKTTAVHTLTAVPETSARHTAAQVAAVRIRLSPVPGARTVSADDLHEAGQLVGRLQIDDGLRQRLTAEVLQAALNRVLGGEPLGSERLLGSEPDQRGLRFGLEQSYRAQARQAVDTMRRIELVDLANQVRPRTWS
jgi:serine/threonine-protein kinase PknG